MGGFLVAERGLDRKQRERSLGVWTPGGYSKEGLKQYLPLASQMRK